MRRRAQQRLFFLCVYKPKRCFMRTKAVAKNLFGKYFLRKCQGSLAAAANNCPAHTWGCVARWEKVGMCVAAFLGSQNLHPSVTTTNLLPDMFLRCDTRKHRNLRNFDGYRSVRQDAEKRPRSTKTLDRLSFFIVTVGVQRMPIDSSISM